MIETVQSPVAPPPPLIEEEKRSNKIIYLLISIIVLLLVMGVGIFAYLGGKKSVVSHPTSSQAPSFAGISGTLDFNGVAPSGSTVSVGVTSVGSPTVRTVATNISPTDGANWAWPQAQGGAAYNVTAYLNYNGQIIAQSKTLTVASPAENESLTIDVLSSSIPSSNPTPTPSSTSISGTVGIDGYIPAGATISVAVAPIGQLPLNVVSSGILASDGVGWSWNGAVTDQEYQVQATIMQNGTAVAQSAIMTMSAPAANEVLSINSTAQPPAPQPVGVSGTVNLNGSIPSNSYITLGYRTTGSPTFTSVSGNISATDNASWSIPNLSSGQSYDIQAYLWVNNQPFSQSQILTIPAPAANEVLTINSTQAPTNTPGSSSISASCGGSQGNNSQASITYNVGGNIQNAAQYQITIGTSSQNNNTYTTTVSPSNPNQQQSLNTPYILNNNVTYYVQYAYATCQTCGTFSNFSPSVSLTCQ